MTKHTDETLSDVQPEGYGHLNDDEPTTPEQRNDPLGQNGPSYEVNQGTGAEDRHPGGSTDPANDRSHADSPERDAE